MSLTYDNKRSYKVRGRGGGGRGEGGGERGWGIPNPSKLCPSNDRAIISTIVVKSFSDLH